MDVVTNSERLKLQPSDRWGTRTQPARGQCSSGGPGRSFTRVAMRILRDAQIDANVHTEVSDAKTLQGLPYGCVPDSEMYLSSAVTAADALRVFSRAR